MNAVTVPDAVAALDMTNEAPAVTDTMRASDGIPGPDTPLPTSDASVDESVTDVPPLAVVTVSWRWVAIWFGIEPPVPGMFVCPPTTPRVYGDAAVVVPDTETAVGSMVVTPVPDMTTSPVYRMPAELLMAVMTTCEPVLSGGPVSQEAPAFQAVSPWIILIGMSGVLLGFGDPGADQNGGRAVPGRDNPGRVLSFERGADLAAESRGARHGRDALSGGRRQRRPGGDGVTAD